MVAEVPTLSNQFRPQEPECGADQLDAMVTLIALVPTRHTLPGYLQLLLLAGILEKPSIPG